jgi:arylsulfatase A-like enzyme
MSTTYAVPRNFTMIPKHLKALGYTTAAVGKWHLGYFSDDVIPTGRGFDTFFGYYGGAEDYNTHKVGKYLDIHDDVAGGSISPAVGYDGRYSTHIYTDRAVKIISSFGSELQQWKDEHSQRRHGSAAGNDGSSGSGAEEDEPSLFMYLAYQAIHSPDEAPQSYIDRFNSTIPNEHRRIVAGMISALDEGIGNVTIALRAAGLTDRTIIVFTTGTCSAAAGTAV